MVGTPRSSGRRIGNHLRHVGAAALRPCTSVLPYSPGASAPQKVGRTPDGDHGSRILACPVAPSGAQPYVYRRSYIRHWENLNDEPLCARLRNNAVATANRRYLGDIGNVAGVLPRATIIRHTR